MKAPTKIVVDRGVKFSAATKSEKSTSVDKFSPTWVVYHPKDAPSYKLELITRIRDGVKKNDWKDLIASIGAREKEFEDILPTSISSMQKKKVYSKETSERIYEISRLFGLGFEVFDSPDDFKRWLITPSKALGNKKPFDLLDSSFGFDIVENEIVRIQYNVYS
ncbi:antitoxin Xre/MbcA/ParS toxin-binding domain-containing protein [Flavobacterium aurantiibacter]|uniref:Antitoxin of toxin-antitoxin stability system n=1 Tax=Flavobacterium aurantiibacter TaxID=2023067 RepID=A0A255ZDY3_9FLAO|nr:antitoxin Xre/MbcA/ParS toxin-binding domain-containing protein [Flavobacterium aurantiibacter]OYQ39669.1 antitoxin of toxin-antitoxin stability system [Flavobacterium aurantiibacter]